MPLSPQPNGGGVTSSHGAPMPADCWVVLEGPQGNRAMRLGWAKVN